MHEQFFDYGTSRLKPSDERDKRCGRFHLYREFEQCFLPFSETSSAVCSGQVGVSDVFAAALWLIDAMFNAANAGVSGVNIFTDFNDAYDLLGFNSNPFSIQFIRLEYYGLVLFQEATQNTAKLLTVSSLTTTANLSVWATVDASSVDRVVVIKGADSV